MAESSYVKQGASIGCKYLSDADLGRGNGSQTHIGLLEGVFDTSDNGSVRHDVPVYVCDKVGKGTICLDFITSGADSSLRSPKIRIGSSDEEKRSNIARAIRIIAEIFPNRKWFMFFSINRENIPFFAFLLEGSSAWNEVEGRLNNLDKKVFAVGSDENAFLSSFLTKLFEGSKTDDITTNRQNGDTNVELFPNAIIIPIKSVHGDDKEKILGGILKQAIASAEKGSSMRTLHYFGLQYAKIIQDNNLSKKRIIEEAGKEPSFESELLKMINLYNECVIQVPPVLSYDEIEENHFDNSQQIIYYGVPGSGKSNAIDNFTAELERPSFQKTRVVFHPDYSNSDFVGQIMPKKAGDSISYDFKEGPFTSILKKAYENPNLPFFLIIEEINRGNAAAIFGDVFQLLDRDGDGWSKYDITNEEVCKKVHGEEKAKEMEYTIKLPPNLSILATMNTSDQNVFTLDNAFQRRWKMVHVKNEFKDDDKSDIQRDSKIEGTNMTWGRFLFGEGETQGINSLISRSSNNSGMSSLEDKRIGCWFVINNEGKITKEDFSNKVLKYLWDDAFHFDKSVFATKIETFDELVEAFEKREQLFADLKIPYSLDNDGVPEAGEQ